METIKYKYVEKRSQDFYFVDKSFDDGKGSVHVPVKMVKIKGVPDVDLENLDRVMSEISDKYPDLVFTKEWDFSPGDDGIKEYLFFYTR